MRQTSLSAWALSSALCLLVLGCTAFPVIDTGQCGNRVIEAGEDCDYFALGPGLVCRPPGTTDACHLDCSPREGKPGACLPGWGCDAGFTCRRPTGQYASGAIPVEAGAWSLASGDFDGDGRADVMALEPLDAVGSARARFSYFDTQGALAETREFPKPIISPSIRDVSGDGLSDVAFSTGPVAVMLGRTDRHWVPETFSSYGVTGATVRAVGVYDGNVGGASPIVALISNPKVSPGAKSLGLYIASSTTGQLERRANLLANVSDLAGDPVSGNLFEDRTNSPCFEPVMAIRGETHFTVMNTCMLDADGVVDWLPRFQVTQVSLKPPTAIDAGPQIVDLDGDGHLDVLIGAGGKPFVSYGDGTTLAPATPYRLLLQNPNQVSPDIEMPLVAGDLTGDSAPEFVFRDRLLVSTRTPGSALPSYAVTESRHEGSLWTSAKIADFNANGKLDLVAASDTSLNIDFYNGTGSASLTKTAITTSASVRFLETGDFDGDAVTDLALIEAPAVGESASPVRIAFGMAFALPAAPITIAQSNGPEQLASYRSNGLASLTVASNGAAGGERRGVLTFLYGSADRVLLAPFALADFESSGTTGEAAAFGLAAGRFTRSSGAGDLFALGFGRQPSPDQPLVPMQAWLLPQVETLDSSPRLLSSDVDGELMPLRLSASGSDFSADLAGTAADLDGDGFDEAVFAMPAGNAQEQCGIATFKVDSQPPPQALSPQLTALAPVLLDEPCSDPQLAAADLDGDGSPDLALLTGRAASSERTLYVLWNDRSGGFSSDRSTRVSGSDSPQSFAVLPASAAGAVGLVYVTADALRLVRSSPTGAQFAEPETISTEIVGGTGIVAADVNGDRVADLVLAESGKLRVLKAELADP